MDKKIKVGIYLRLSQEDKNKINKDEDSESIKNQRNMLIDYIKKHPEFILVDEYCDEDLSGAGTYRPEFERLISDCENKKIEIVLCKSQSRFSRDMEIVEKYINNKFREWNIRFIGLADNADTQNYGNKKARQINGLVNEWYLEDVSQNIRCAFNSKMKHGEFISPFACFGYEVSPLNNNKLVVDQEAAKIVKEIYSLYLNGMGFTKIAKYLNEFNIPSPSFYKYQKGIKLNVISKQKREEIKWSHNAIKSILTNEIYIGNLIQGKRTTVSYKNHKIIKKDKDMWIRKENTHEAIIDKDTFEKVKKAIKERTKPMKKKGIVHIFSGKVFCMECKHYMRKKNSSKHEYLVCLDSEYDKCKNKKGIRYDTLENIILNEINKKIKKYYDKELIEKEINKKKLATNKVRDLEKQKLELEKKIDKNRIYLKNLYEDKINKNITNTEFNDLVSTYNKEKDLLNKKITTLNCEINNCKKKENFSDLLEKYQKLTSLNKIIVDEFINKIYIGNLNINDNRRNIQIKWNF